MFSTNTDYVEYNYPTKYTKINKVEKPVKTIKTMVEKKMKKQVRKKHTSNITRKVENYHF
jgi:hypothetical protein